MLKANAIRKAYPTPAGELVVLDELDLDVAANQSVAIMGPSGCGKSTLLNILGTLDEPTSGRVRVDGVDPFSLDEKKLAQFRNQKIGLVFQEHHLLPQCSALENVLLPTLVSKAGGDRLTKARSLLESVGLADRADHRPAELSGGERQRVALARALINDPAIVLADEPTGSLDRKIAQRIIDVLLELHQQSGRVLIVVTHNEHVADRFDVKMELIDGRLRRLE